MNMEKDLEEDYDWFDKLAMEEEPKKIKESVSINEEFRDLIPPLSKEEFDTLEQSILENGVTDPIQLWKGYIVDGHNRFNICKKHNLTYGVKELFFCCEEDAKIYIINKQIGRRNINAFVKLELTEKLREELRKKGKENQGYESKSSFVINDKTEIEDETNEGLDFIFPKVNTRKEIAKITGVSDGLVAQYDKIQKTIDDETKKKLRENKITIGEVYKEIKTNEKKAEIAQIKDDIENGKFILPEGKFQTIMMDVPWPYGTQYDAGTRRVGNPYPEMSMEDIYNLDIPSDKDCVLFFWTTQKFLEESFKIVRSYGFDYKGLIVWNKDMMGMGATLRMQCEFCLVCFKGNPMWNITDMRDIITEKRREHSRKPDTLYDIINKNLIGRKLDYFSREERENWETFGYEKFKK